MPVTEVPDERDIIFLPSGREANFKDLHLDDFDSMDDVDAIETNLTNRIIEIRAAIAHFDSGRSRQDESWRIRAQTALSYALAYRHRCQMRRAKLKAIAKEENIKRVKEMQSKVIEAAKLRAKSRDDLLKQTRDFQSEFVAAARRFLPPDLYSAIRDMANAKLSPHINRDTSQDEPQAQAPIHDNQTRLGPVLDGPGS